MGERGSGRRWGAVVLGLCACLAVAACAAADTGADQERHGGFYAGVSGGLTRP